MFKSALPLALLFAMLLTTSLPVLAHDGGHDTPGAVQAPKGGVIRSLETVHLELLPEGKTVKIYIYASDLKAADVTKYPVSATVILPKKKPEAVKLAEKGDHWELSYDAKGAHRYTFQLDIKQGGHDDKVRWTVEPKKR